MEDWGVVELLLNLGLRWRRVYDEFHTPAVLPCQYPPYSRCDVRQEDGWAPLGLMFVLGAVTKGIT